MSVTETCMIESDPALVLTAGITDPEQVQMLCADFFAREKEKEASYKKLPGLDLPYIYIAMMAGVPEVELEKGIPGTSPAENEKETSHEELPRKPSEDKEHTTAAPGRRENERRPKETGRRPHPHGDTAQQRESGPQRDSAQQRESGPQRDSAQQRDSGSHRDSVHHRDSAQQRDLSHHRDTAQQRDLSHHRDTAQQRDSGYHRDSGYQRDSSHPQNSSPTQRSHSGHSGHSSRSMQVNHSHTQVYSHPDPHLHRRQDHTQHLHPHRAHGMYTHLPQPPPIYHHGIPTTDLNTQQQLHSYFSMPAQYKEPAFQLTADLYQAPTNYSYKPNAPPTSAMDPHAPKFTMGPRQGAKRTNHYPSMHHRQHSPTMGSKGTEFYPDVSHLVNYNIGLPFNPNQKQTKFFILTSTVEENIFQSLRYGVWSSTSRGNKTLQTAINDGNSVILFYGAARMDYMYGCAEMKSSVDFEALTGLWHDDNWKGKFHVKWFYLKNVPKLHLANISEYNNPFRMCRDGMEVPWDVARRALDIFKGFKARSSLLDKSIEFRPKLLHKTLKC